KVFYDPGDHSKVVIDMDSMPVVPGVDRDEALARHERVMEQARDPEARRKWRGEKQANAQAQIAGAAENEKMIMSRYSPSRSSGASSGGVAVADELAKLAALRDRGILSDAEFETQKARLLGG